MVDDEDKKQSEEFDTFGDEGFDGSDPADVDFGEEEDVFETFDDEDDPFELDDEDEAFAESAADTDTSMAPLNAVTGANPVKLAAGFVGAIAIAFVAWKVIGGASDKETPVALQNEIATVQAPAPIEENTSELAGLFDAPVETLPENKTMPEAPPEEAPEVAPPLPVAEAPMPSEPMPEAAPPAPPAIVQAEVDLSGVEALMAEYNEVMTARLRRLESGLRNVTDDLDDINRHLGNMGDRVSKVGQVVDNMSNQFKLLGNSQENDRSEMARQEMFANPTLHVHAVIPGRAWLKKHDGGILTVSEGDLLGEYGKVLAIDASSGAVVTSSGVTLR